MANRICTTGRSAVILAALAAVLAGCSIYDYGDQRRVHDLYPDYVDPPPRSSLDLGPTAQPDVVQ